MKAVADSFANADKVLSELFEFEQVALDMTEQLDTYANIGNGRSLPRFITETSVALKQLLVKDFSLSYPNIQGLVENGNSASLSLGRLHDAIFKFNQVQQEVHKANCVIMVDVKRSELVEKLKDVVGDICVFIVIQYSLNRVADGELPVSIMSHCERVGITPEVLYGVMIDTLKNEGRSWYAYESISPVYQDFMDYDSSFLAECEDNMYPISDEMAQSLINGDADLSYIRGLLLTKVKDMVEEEVNVTPSTLLAQMRLD